MTDASAPGNCLFSALSDQLHGLPNAHRSTRNKVVKYMSRHPDYFKQFLTVYPGGGTRRNPPRSNAGSYASTNYNGRVRPTDEEIDKAWHQHLVAMAQLGTWADYMEIVAFAAAYSVNVKIYQNDNCHTITADTVEGGKPLASGTPTIHIAYYVRIDH